MQSRAIRAGKGVIDWKAALWSPEMTRNWSQSFIKDRTMAMCRMECYIKCFVSPRLGASMRKGLMTAVLLCSTGLILADASGSGAQAQQNDYQRMMNAATAPDPAQAADQTQGQGTDQPQISDAQKQMMAANAAMAQQMVQQAQAQVQAQQQAQQQSQGQQGNSGTVGAAANNSGQQAAAGGYGQPLGGIPAAGTASNTPGAEGSLYGSAPQANPYNPAPAGGVGTTAAAVGAVSPVAPYGAVTTNPYGTSSAYGGGSALGGRIGGYGGMVPSSSGGTIGMGSFNNSPYNAGNSASRSAPAASGGGGGGSGYVTAPNYTGTPTQ